MANEKIDLESLARPSGVKPLKRDTERDPDSPVAPEISAKPIEPGVEHPELMNKEERADYYARNRAKTLEEFGMPPEDPTTKNAVSKCC